MCSKLQNGVKGLIDVFYKYSGKDDDIYKLNKAELKDLLQAELGDLLGDPKDPSRVDKIMADLDQNRDGQVDFEEFVITVTALTAACNDYSKASEDLRKKRSSLTKAMISLTEVFQSSCGKEDKLSKGELKTLLQKDLNDLLVDCKNDTAVTEIMTDLNDNKDDNVDFQDFVITVALLTIAKNKKPSACSRKYQ
ncbi:protein S100-Z-like [Mastacembelus armatus]|uniref:Protein S100-Z-like n=1 Tax=Mastacembelus armatus TaxID=205130 RepID=A0A7N9B1I8_9TELE|nr:protein S100-Z-like [Mastacembelus armatus]